MKLSISGKFRNYKEVKDRECWFMTDIIDIFAGIVKKENGTYTIYEKGYNLKPAFAGLYKNRKTVDELRNQAMLIMKQELIEQGFILEES